MLRRIRLGAVFGSRVRSRVVLAGLCSLVLVCAGAGPAAAMSQDWAHLLGSVGDEQIVAAATDAASNVFVVGTTTGELSGSPDGNVGVSSAFVASYAADGTLRWVHELGAAAATTTGSAVAVGSGGAVFVVGSSDGTVTGASPANRGGVDVFAARFDGSGTRQWVRMLGGRGDDRASGASVDGGGDLIVGGTTHGMAGQVPVGREAGFVAALSPSHAVLWLTLVGGTQPKQTTVGNVLAADCDGNFYLGGATTGVAPGGYVASVDGAGVLRWDSSVGDYTGDSVNALAADCSGNVYGMGATRDYPTSHRRRIEPELFAIGQSDGSSEWIEYNAGGINGGMATDDAHSMLFLDGGGGLLGVAVSSVGTGNWYWTSIGDAYHLNLQAATLDQAGNLDLVGATNGQGQSPAPELYAGGANDGYITHIANPSVPPDATLAGSAGRH